MANFIGINEAATKKAIKNSMKDGGLVVIQAEGQHIYFCNGHFILKLPRLFYDSIIMPATLHAAPAEGETIQYNNNWKSWDLVPPGSVNPAKLLRDSAKEITEAAKKTIFSCDVKSGKKTKSARVFLMESGPLVVDSMFIDILEDGFLWCGKSATSPVISYDGSTIEETDVVLLAMPMRQSAIKGFDKLAELAQAVQARA